MRVLGIDPGTATLGWGLIERIGSTTRAVEYGALLTSPDDPPALRLRQLYDGLCDIRDRLCPDVGAVEKLYFGQNSRTALAVGQARGIVLLVLEQSQIRLVEMSPTEVKQAVTGYGRAEKRQVQLMVQRLLGLKEYPKPDDVADALAIAICGAELERYQKVVGPR